jgi:hypothetical protein
MGDGEKYFLIGGMILAVIISYLSAQHGKTRGFSFTQAFIYGTIALCGLVLMAWQYFWGR